MNTIEFLWGDEPKPKRRSAQSSAAELTPKRSVVITDILVWLQQNAPEDTDDLKDLRLALYQQRSYGKYSIEETRHIDQFVVNGPHSALLIVSEKARHFLLRNLCRLRRKNGFRGF